MGSALTLVCPVLTCKAERAQLQPAQRGGVRGPRPPADTRGRPTSRRSFSTLLPEPFAKEALKPDTSAERSGGRGQIASGAARVRAEEGEGRGARARSLKLTRADGAAGPAPTAPLPGPRRCDAREPGARCACGGEGLEPGRRKQWWGAMALPREKGHPS